MGKEKGGEAVVVRGKPGVREGAWGESEQGEPAVTPRGLGGWTGGLGGSRGRGRGGGLRVGAERGYAGGQRGGRLAQQIRRVIDHPVGG